MSLVVVLIMLVLLTLFAVNTYNRGKSSMEVVNNFQSRNEATAAAQEAIERVVSIAKITTTDPAGAASIIPPVAGCSAAANTICVDVNGDGVNDITVKVKGRGTDNNPSCVKARVIPNAQLDLRAESDLVCATSRTVFGVQGAPPGDSLCGEVLYEIVANATDNVTQANVTVTEGVAARVPLSAILNYCK